LIGVFQKHVSALARSCIIIIIIIIINEFHRDASLTKTSGPLCVTCFNYYAQAFRHIRHLLTTELAQTLAYGLILSRIDYCNAVLHGAPRYSIKKLQRVQKNAARIVLEAPRRSHARPLLGMLHWLPIQLRIDYKVALLPFKSAAPQRRRTSVALIQDHEHSHNMRSTTTTLCQPVTTTTFAKRAFRCSAPAVWNSLPTAALNSDSVAVFKSRLKTFLFSRAFSYSSAH